jgi:hypothetical protein
MSQIRLHDACALWLHYAFYFHLHRELSSWSLSSRTRNVTPVCRSDVLGLLWPSVFVDTTACQMFQTLPQDCWALFSIVVSLTAYVAKQIFIIPRFFFSSNYCIHLKKFCT